MKKMFLVLLFSFSINLIYSQNNFIIIPPKDWKEFQKSDIINSINNKYILPEKTKQDIIKNNQSVQISRFGASSKKGTYSPNIQVLLRPNATKSFSDFKKSLEISIRGFSNSIEDFQITDDFKEVKIGGKDGLMTKFEGNLKTNNGEKVFFRSILIAIPDNNTFYQITLNDTNIDSYEEEFKKVISSIEIK